MSTRKVVKNLEAAINRICEDINEKKTGSGADKLDSLSKLVNSYSRLIERGKKKEHDRMMDGDPNYYKNLLKAEKKDMKGITSVVSHKRLVLSLFVLRERGNVQPG